MDDWGSPHIPQLDAGDNSALQNYHLHGSSSAVVWSRTSRNSRGFLHVKIALALRRRRSTVAGNRLRVHQAVDPSMASRQPRTIHCTQSDPALLRETKPSAFWPGVRRVWHPSTGIPGPARARLNRHSPSGPFFGPTLRLVRDGGRSGRLAGPPSARPARPQARGQSCTLPGARAPYPTP